MSSVKTLLRSHSGHLVDGAFAIVGTSVIIWDNHVGRNHAVNSFDTKIDGVKADISRVEKKLEMEIHMCQSMILQIGRLRVSNNTRALP